MFVKVVPPSVLISHWTVGVGYPVAAAVNVALEPAAADVLVGLVVTMGAAGLSALICTFARRTLPDELLRAEPDTLTQSAPVAALTMRMPKLGSLLTPEIPSRFAVNPL